MGLSIISHSTPSNIVAVAMEILCGNLFPGFMPYNELYGCVRLLRTTTLTQFRFIQMRKEAHKAIHTNESAQIHRPSELKEASLFCLNLLKCTPSPDTWEKELERLETSAFSSGAWLINPPGRQRRSFFAFFTITQRYRPSLMHPSLRKSRNSSRQSRMPPFPEHISLNSSPG